MAGNRKLYRRAFEKWEHLHESQSYSVPDEIGTLAVAYSCHEYGGDKSDIGEFKEEAQEIHHLLQRKRRVEVVALKSAADFDDIIKDHTASSIVTIGHGALSYLYLDGCSWKGKPGIGNRYDWLDISKASTHLKTGLFVQRQCGNETRVCSVPLGLFAVVDARQVTAAVGSNFNPKNIYEPANEIIRPITNQPYLTYDQIKDNFRHENFLNAVLSDPDLS